VEPQAQKPKAKLWTVRVPAASEAETVGIEAALEPFALALSSFETDGGRAWVTEALCGRRPSLYSVRAALAGTTAGEIEIAAVPDKDWVAESQRELAPIRAERFFVHGSHFAGKPPRGSIAIEIDAGLAFGTGRHETTRGCLLALVRLAKERKFRRPLDLGTGSGILAIAMAKLWDVDVLASDNDPQATKVARENAGLNGVGERVRVATGAGYGLPAVRDGGPYDLVTANILARPLMRLAPGLARHLAPKGIALLSGLLVEQEEMVLEAHARQGLGLLWRIRLGEWSVLAVGRKPARKASGRAAKPARKQERRPVKGRRSG
jgi:ribosomal protein L11 methyltransferase